MSPEKVEASIYREVCICKSSPFKGQFSAGCSSGQCPARRYPARRYPARLWPLRQPQNMAGESLLVCKPLLVCNASSSRRSCAGSVMALTREDLLVLIA